MTRTLLLPFGVALAAATLSAQTPCPENDNRGDRDRGRYCEIRESSMANAGRLNVDAGTNGGIKIVGSDRADVLVRAKVQGNAPTMEEARALVNSVRINATPGNIRSEGPMSRDQHGWAVSFEVLVPRRSALELKAHNGGITISGVEGDISFHTQNGGVTLQALAGEVKGQTVNGGLNVELEGNTWRGSQMDVQTTNGGIQVKVPQSYSARFETSTVNGNLSTNIPEVQVPSRQERERERNVSVTLGSGGPLVRLVTTNGGIRLNRS